MKKELRQRREAFGNHIRSLRLERTFYNENTDCWEHLTQEQLASLIGRPNKKYLISRLELGEIKDIEKYLQPLADAFDLSYEERLYLYQLAGYPYPHEEPPPTAEAPSPYELHQVADDCQYPTKILTSLWDICLINSLCCGLYGITPDVIDKLNKNQIGANWLCIYFPEAIGKDQLFRISNYTPEEVVYAFQQSALPHKATGRYRAIVSHMLKHSVSFQIAWQNVNEARATNRYSFQRGIRIHRITHSIYGGFDFELNQVADTSGHKLVIIRYIPVRRTQDRYWEFTDSVKESMPTIFRYRPPTSQEAN